MAQGIPTANDAAAALALAYSKKHAGQAPPQNALVLPLAQLMGEGSLSSYFQGSNNLGAMTATASFAKAHANDAGYGLLAFLDHGPGGGAYVTRMAIYPSLAVGAWALLSLVEQMVNLATVQDVTDFSTQLYVHGYYTGTAAPVTPLAERAAAVAAGTLLPGDLANIAAYANLVHANIPAATAAVLATPSYQGDPAAITVGPPFAPLASRLTPAGAYAPHTLEHAQALLGAAATAPPAGAISLSDALSAPGGEGVWLFGPAQPSPSLPAPAPTPNPALATGASVVAVVAGTALATILLQQAGAFSWLRRATA